MANPNGVPANLVARHPGNVNAGRHGIFSPAMREARAQEVADELMALPHVVEADRRAAEQVGRELALVEALTERLLAIGLSGPAARVALLLDYLGRAEGRLHKQLSAFGGTPLSRAKWARELAEGESLATSIQRRRARAGGGTS